MKDPIHYRGNGTTPCRVAMKSMFTNVKLSCSSAYWWGCAFKYLWRWPLKDGVKDLNKCLDCVTKLRDGLTPEEVEEYGKQQSERRPR